MQQGSSAELSMRRQENQRLNQMMSQTPSQASQTALSGHIQNSSIQGNKVQSGKAQSGKAQSGKAQSDVSDNHAHNSINSDDTEGFAGLSLMPIDD